MSNQYLSHRKLENGLSILPKLEGLGGPSSFQSKLIKGLAKKGIQTNFDPLKNDSKTLLVVGGTKQLHTIWLARKRGIRVVQRLNGMNWIHTKKNTGFKPYRLN